MLQNINGSIFSLGYLWIITSISIASKTVSREEKGEGLTFKNLAILMLKKTEKIQGDLGVVTALASMYLFSVLGVKGNPNATNLMVVAVGAISLLFAAGTEFFTLAFGGSERGDQPIGTPTRDSRSNRTISLGGIEGDMTVAGFV